MTTSRGIFLAVICFLGLALLISVGGVIGLAAFGIASPDLLKEVSVGALAGLSGMLVHPPAGGDAQPVVVQQPPNQPVPVDPSNVIDDGPTFPAT